jgi:hypothetical protein
MLLLTRLSLPISALHVKPYSLSYEIQPETLFASLRSINFICSSGSRVPCTLISPLDQYLIPPAQFDKLNSVQVTDSDMVFLVSYNNMCRRNIESPVSTEKGEPLRLK